MTHNEGVKMSKEVYPVGTKVRVTKDHDVTWTTPWPKEGDVLSVVGSYTMPHTFGCKETVYATKNGAGQRVLVREDCIKEFVEPLPEGTLVFVKETHTTKDGWHTNYAGSRLKLAVYYGPYYTAQNGESGATTVVHEDKIAPVEFEQLTPPRAPQSVGAQGQTVWHERGTELEGFWQYSTHWGWSNFVATNPQRYREPELGDSIQDAGVLARGLL